MITVRHRCLVAISLGAACAPAASDNPPAMASASPPAMASDRMLALLPTVPGLPAMGDVERAVGQDLFRVIDGGAPLYLDHGFESLVTQSYKGAGGVQFAVEIYQMKDAEGAEAVFTEKGGIASAEPRLGDGSTFEEYYGLYVCGRYHFAVTASSIKGDLRPPIEQLARAVISNIENAEGKTAP